MKLTAPLTVFVDEAGSADFREPVMGERKKAFAVCAVSVPTIAFCELLQIIPRNTVGELLKASHKDFNNSLAATFVDGLIRSNAEVGACLVDPGAVENVALASKLAKLANDRRAIVRDAEITKDGKCLHPDIKSHDLHYLNFLSQAILACFEVYSAHNQAIPSFVDFVVDTMALDEFQRNRFVNELRRICGKGGIHIGQFEWKREEDEPLLLLPDLFGGILCREDRYHDVGAAAQKL
ncbi:MAG: hypothetical protein MRJ66_00940 [Nitrospira sp.]|nr:hypothetical protein [Nitrospira sp.]